MVDIKKHRHSFGRKLQTLADFYSVIENETKKNTFI